MNKIAAITTFPNNSWDIYAKKMIESYAKYWPKEIPLMIQLDDNLLYDQVNKILPPNGGICVGWQPEHKAFVDRNKDKDHPADYRKQAVRFCHKVFAIHNTLQAIQKAKAVNAADAPRYLIWMDADVITTKPVTMDDIQKCLPKEGDAVAYLGRKDWDHSECGWLAFDLENDGDDIINWVFKKYTSDDVYVFEQFHDSWIWDSIIINGNPKRSVTNLTEDKPGTEIWTQSPMAEWSTHYKGPVAKQQLFEQTAPAEQQLKPIPGQNFIIQTKNAIPDEEICKHIEENQKLIKNWVRECLPNDETLVVVSAGPLMLGEDVLPEIEAGRKIVAVKHALKPLKEAGITPWACILLDPRAHVADFVQDADPNVLWFIASQVNPEVTRTLLARGCEVWGYHAAVGAGETDLTNKQPSAVISGGSATATRGLFMLYHLGFRNFNLYGYDLSLPDKPDLNAKNEFGHPKYLEFSITVKDQFLNLKRSFYSEAQLMAQYEELQEIMKSGKFNLKAYGNGIIPFLLRCQEIRHLRQGRINGIIAKTSYKQLIWNQSKLSQILRKIFSKILRKPRVKSKLLTA